MPATWPASLPQSFLRAGYSEGSADTRIAEPTDAGPVPVRRRASATTVPVRGTMRMTAAEWDILSAFIRDDLAGGVLAFEFPAQRDAGTWLVRLDPTQPLPEPQAIRTGIFRVPLSLVILP